MSQTELVTADVLGAGLDQVNNATAAPTPNQLAKRDGNGRLQAASPAVPGDVATKGYVDARPTGGGSGPSGDAAATPNTLVLRDAAGRAKAADPTVAGDLATKGYADGLVTGLATQGYVDSALTSFGRDLGTGTALPATGPSASALRRGDAYQHTSYGLHFWTGTAWRQRGPHELTASQRAALDTSGIYPGYQVFETDTLLTARWAGGAWQLDGLRPIAQVRATAVQSVASNAWIPLTFGAADIDTEAPGNPQWAAASSGRVTIRRRGIYRLDGIAAFNSSSADIRCGAQLTRNGTALPAGSTMASSGMQPCVILTSTRVQLEVNDYIGVNGVQTGTGALNTTVAADTAPALSIECIRLLP